MSVLIKFIIFQLKDIFAPEDVFHRKLLVGACAGLIGKALVYPLEVSIYAIKV